MDARLASGFCEACSAAHQASIHDKLTPGVNGGNAMARCQRDETVAVSPRCDRPLGPGPFAARLFER
jgi:hypothetical protein